MPYSVSGIVALFLLLLAMKTVDAESPQIQMENDSLPVGEIQGNRIRNLIK